MTNWRVFGFMAKERMSPERLLSRWSIDLFREHNRLFGTHTVIFPVNYAIDRGNVVFRTDPGTKFHAAVHK